MNIQLCRANALINNQCIGLTVDEDNIFLVRKYEKVYAYKNACPHLGVPLEWRPNQFLDTDNELIQCATHGALFKIEDGVCLSGPCVNQKLQRLPIMEKNNIIYWVK